MGHSKIFASISCLPLGIADNMTNVPEIVNRLPTDEFAKYEKNDRFLLLSTGSQGITIKK
jgi:hypothetical protein